MTYVKNRQNCVVIATGGTTSVKLEWGSTFEEVARPFPGSIDLKPWIGCQSVESYEVLLDLRSKRHQLVPLHPEASSSASK